MQITQGDPSITFTARGEITGEWPEFSMVYAPEREYLAVRYEVLFTHTGAGCDSTSIQVTGANKSQHGQPGGRTRTVHFGYRAESTPDWVRVLVDRVRPTISL